MSRSTNAKAKERKQKIALAVGGVLLLGLLAFQGPKFLKLMHGGSAATTATTTSTTSTTSTPSATAPAATGPPSSLAAQADKLASLTLFRAKDPFVQLVSDSGATASSPAPTPAPAPAPAPAPTPAPSSSSTSGPLFGTVAGGGAARSGGLPTARILLNGSPVQVALGRAFPATKPVFRLAGVLPGGVSISLAKGDLADGSSALKLRKGQSLTLMNTVDRRRYTIKLLATKGA
jgi:hypothetical protein